MTRVGKIARLPFGVREQLNRRLRDGEQGESLLKWLNELPEVQAVLKHQFGGVPISKNNLSKWRLGGHQEWLARQEWYDHVSSLVEDADSLAEAVDGGEISECLGTILAAELARTAKALLAETADPRERWKRLQEILPQLAELRRADCRYTRVYMDEQRWQRESEELEQAEREAAIAKAKAVALAPITAMHWHRFYSDFYGGGKNGDEIADQIISVRFDLPFPDPLGRNQPSPQTGPVAASNSQ